MIKVRYNLPSDEMSFVADRILQYYIRDRKLFEKYSDDFDDEFIEVFEDRINDLKHLQIPEEIADELNTRKNSLRIAVNHFMPLIIITEEYAKLANDVLNVPVSYFNFGELIEIVKSKRGWEIREAVTELTRKLEEHLPELKFKGFPEMIIDNLNLLVKSVGRLELEVAELTHKRDLYTAEGEQVISDLWEVIDYIINTCPKIFGHGRRRKINDYAVERLMKLAHSQRQFIH